MFLDTNVLVYAFDRAEPVKRRRAIEVLDESDWVISTQVLQEFFVVTTRRLAKPMKPDEALGAIDDFLLGNVVASDGTLVRAAAERSIRSQLSLWDAMIVEAARRSGCDQILTEDLNDGQDFDGVVIVDPFRTT